MIGRLRLEFCSAGSSLPCPAIEPGFELSFRTSPRWRQRAKSIQFNQVTLTIPHPIDILIGKLARLEPKDLEAFRRTLELTGHPTPDELQRELQIAVDLFRPEFDESPPNCYPENTRKLWREVFQQDIDVREQIIEPAVAKRKMGFGEIPPNYKAALNRKNPAA